MKQSVALLLVSRKKRTHSDLPAKPGDLSRGARTSERLPKALWLLPVPLGRASRPTNMLWFL
jgi:hypothetical protein